MVNVTSTQLELELTSVTFKEQQEAGVVVVDAKVVG